MSLVGAVRPLPKSGPSPGPGAAASPRTHNRWQGLEKYAIALDDSASMRFGRDLLPFGDICNFLVITFTNSVFTSYLWFAVFLCQLDVCRTGRTVVFIRPQFFDFSEKTELCCFTGREHFSLIIFFSSRKVRLLCLSERSRKIRL